MATLYTIGHSTRPIEEFLNLLIAHDIKHLIDIRTIPRSRRYPWFSQATLKIFLQNEGIQYTHLPALGGMRHAKKDSINTGWKNAAFRGYADYMQTEEFFLGLKKLNSFVKKSNQVCIMCAEALPWRCHRSLVSDAEVARGVKVLHIMSKEEAKEHELTPFAIVNIKTRPIQIWYCKKPG